MTKEEAINKIKGYLTDYLPIEDYEEAEEIVKALEQEPCGDCIGRQAAIDVVKGIDRSFVKYIEELPSAQPEIIRCKDCKFYTAMNRKTKSGICSLIMHQNFGDDWYCAGAERRTDG